MFFAYVVLLHTTWSLGLRGGVCNYAEGPYMAENQPESRTIYVVGKLNGNIKTPRNFTFSISNFRRVPNVVSFSFGSFTGVWILCADVSEHSVFSIFIGGVFPAYTTWQDAKFFIIFYITNIRVPLTAIRKRNKKSRNRPGVTQRVPGDLHSQISMTYGTWR